MEDYDNKFFLEVKQSICTHLLDLNEKVKMTETGIVYDSLVKDLKLEDYKGIEKKFIYIIYIKTEMNDLNQSYLEAKTKTQRSFAKINKENENSKVLYVGSSKNIYSRLQNHIQGKSEKTYSLHMKSWVIDSDNIYIKLLSFDDSVEDTVIQLIEDEYWDKYKPRFGKQGKK